MTPSTSIAIECLRSIAEASDREPRQPDDADWRFRFLETKRAAQCALAAIEPSTPATTDAGALADDLRKRMPRYVSSVAREIALEILNDMDGERHDGGLYAIARWVDALRKSALREQAAELLEAEASRYDGEAVVYSGNHVSNILATQATRIRSKAPPQETRGDEPVAPLRTALEDIVSWKNDTLGKRPKVHTSLDCAPEITEAFDRGARMALFRCADRASMALAASQQSPRLEREGIAQKLNDVRCARRGASLSRFTNESSEVVEELLAQADAILALLSPDTTVVSSISQAQDRNPEIADGGWPNVGEAEEFELNSARALLREKPSTSYLQRKMSITYNHACSLIVALEKEGFISGADSAGRRTVLSSKDHP